MKLLVIGGGNMGLTYAKSIAKNKPDTTITILEKAPEKVEELKNTTSFLVFDAINDCPNDIDTILLAVKPQVIKQVCQEIAPFINDAQLVISIMAGVTVQTISEALSTTKIVRAMPNLPSQVGHGVTGYFISNTVTNTQSEAAVQILEATGVAIQVSSEDKIDAITALSGSGPAYVFYFMEAMMQQATDFGFNESEAKNIVLNTFLGTSQLFASSETSANEWINRVTSKGGTTHAALSSFRQDETGEKIIKGVKAAYKRAKELSKN